MRFVWVSLLLSLVAPAYANETLTITQLTQRFDVTFSDGSAGSLAGIVPLGQLPDKDAPVAIAPQWKAAPIRLEEASADRYGRMQYWVYRRSDNQLLQADLVKQGTAMAYSPMEELPDALASLPVAPQVIIAADKAQDKIGQWAQVQGRITEVSIQKTSAYLNFGEDWKQDFTIHLPKATMKAYGAEALQALTNQMVQVRGYVHRYAGARITLLEPSMLEVIGNASH